MNNFIDISQIFKEIKILILGSYLPKNLKILEGLKQFLRRKGFENTYLGKDLKESDLSVSIKNKSNLYKRIESAIREFDFNLFIFFHNINSNKIKYKKENESTIIELSSLLHFEDYKNKENRTLVLLPKDYNSTMLLELIEEKRVNVFNYENLQQIYPRCFIFIKQNI